VARFRILYWHEIPTVVEATDDNGNRHKEQLSSRFQELVDRVAMKRKLAGTDAYLEGWRRSRPKMREGDASDVAKTVASEMEDAFDEIVLSANDH